MLKRLIALAVFACVAANVTAGSIEGRVTASATAQPISTGTVRIFNSAGTLLGSAFPDATGNYAYGGLAAGTYFARTNGTGFFDELWDNKPCAQGVCTVASGTPISVGAGATTVNFALDAGGSIAGKVTASANGQPISTGTVRIFNSTGTLLGSAFPDAAGNYTYSGLAAGIYFARTNATGFFDELWDNKPCAQGVCTTTSGTPISVGAGMTTVNFSLDAGGSIKGKITASATGQPISNGTVRIYNSTGTLLGSAFPDAGGNYIYGGLAAGTYFARTNATGLSDQLWNGIPCADGNCTVTAGTPISVGMGATVANFSLGAGGAIAGKVTASANGQPISAGTVRIFNSAGTLLGSAFPDAAGNYTYGGLAAGSYFARTNATGFFDELWDNKPCPQGVCTITSGTPISVGASATTANFSLDAGGSIAGKVTSSANGQPISTGTVRIFNSTGTLLGSAFPDANGNYTYGGLAAGIYFARTNGTGFIDELWNDKPCPQGVCTITSGTAINVSASGATIANFQLAGSVDLIFRNGFETASSIQAKIVSSDESDETSFEQECAAMRQQTADDSRCWTAVQ